MRSDIQIKVCKREPYLRNFRFHFGVRFLGAAGSYSARSVKSRNWENGEKRYDETL